MIWDACVESVCLRTPAQVLAPMRKGAAGVARLNMRLQQLLNPPATDRAELVITSAAAERPQILRVGDRVIQVGGLALVR